MRDFRPFHTDSTALAIGVVTSVLVNLLTSCDFNIYLLWGMSLLLLGLFSCLAYYIISKKIMRDINGEIIAQENGMKQNIKLQNLMEAIQENSIEDKDAQKTNADKADEIGLDQQQRYDIESRECNKYKYKLRFIGLAAILLCLSGIVLSLLWRFDIFNTQHTNDSISFKKEAEILKLTNQLNNANNEIERLKQLSDTSKYKRHPAIK